MDDLRNIPAPLVARAKEMGVVPWIHKSDFVFEFVTRLWKGDADRAMYNYYELGKYSATQAKAWVGDYLTSLEKIHERNNAKEPAWSPTRVLDFASGYGCVARHLSLQFPGSKIQTCDIHQEAVAFNKEILDIESYQSSSAPESLAVAQQDVIIALSFFSHMPRATFPKWLRALTSHLAPQGVLIFTANGHVTHTSVVREITVDKEGFGFKPISEQKDLPGGEYGLTISYPEFVFSIMRELDVRLVRYQEGLWWATQDTYMYVKT
jgi:SAM-dependent methyltransferase